MSSATTTTMKPLTAAQHGEVLRLMLASNPEKARSDLAARLAEVEHRIAAFSGNYGSPQHRRSWPLRETLPKVREQVALALPLRARGPAVADGSRPPAVAAAAAGVVDAEVHSTLLAAAGQAYVEDLRRQLGPAVATLRARLGEMVADLTVTDARHAGDSYQAGHDATFERYASLVTGKADLEGRIATLEAGFAEGRQAQAGLVAEAIGSAGGADAVARGVRESRMMRRAHWESHPGHADLEAAARVVAGIDADLAKLGGPDAPGPVADSLRADRSAAVAGLEAKRSGVDAGLKAGIAKRVADAIAGDEPARATIEGDARSEPRAFSGGFADALRDAQWERSPLGPLALALVDATGLPLAS